MAMKCSALFLLLIQAEGVSSCVFDKVEEDLPRANLYSTLEAEKNTCLAECYNDKSCIAFAYIEKNDNGEKMDTCMLFRFGNKTYTCHHSATVCYSLQRDEVDLTCQTYLNI